MPIARAALHVYPFFILALGILSFLPMFVTNFRLGVYRSLVPLSGLVIMLILTHASVLTNFNQWSEKAKYCVCGMLALWLSFFAHQQLIEKMVLPSSAEYSILKKMIQFSVAVGREKSPTHVIVQKFEERHRTDEFSVMSVQYPLNVPHVLTHIRREMRLEPVPVSSSLSGEAFNHDGAFVIDMSEFAKTGLWDGVQSSSFQPVEPVKTH